jgi:proteasome lid subunit RPN8/RPN11
MRRLVLSREQLGELVAHARSALPDEACGLLGGREGRVERVVRLNNAVPSPVSYVLEPTEQLRAQRELERAGLRMLAIYHSHPVSPALPSGTDVERALFPGTREPSFPDSLYIIVSLADNLPDVRAFRIGRGGVVTPAEVHVEGGAPESVR